MDALDILILAAEDGASLGSALPRAAQPLLFEPLLLHALGRVAALSARRVRVLVPPGDLVLKGACAALEGVELVEAAAPCLDGAAVTLLVRADAALLAPETLRLLVERCADGAALTYAAGGEKGGVLAACALPGAAADGDLDALVAGAWRDGELVRVPLADPSEALLVRDRTSWWKAQRRLQARVNRGWMEAGAALMDPRSAWIDARTRLAADVLVEPDVTLIRCRVEAGAVLERGVRLVDTAVGAGSRVRQGTVAEDAAIGERCEIGPYARLRPGARLGDRVKVGNFVEIKNSRLSDGTKAAHLSYIGDAVLGRDVNVGCGFITCNYDGVRKLPTVIEDGAFIGSDCQAVAPVRIGAGAYVAAGTTITEDVPAGALALSRVRQQNKPGLAERLRARARAALDGK